VAITALTPAAGGSQGTTVVLTPALPTGLAVDDILVMVGESANQAMTISNSAGGTWTQVTGSPQGTGTAGGVSSAGVQVWWSRYNGTQTAPTIAGTNGDHRAARIYAYRGVDTITAINASAGAVEATSDSSLSAIGVTTTAADCWILYAMALMDDAQDFGATFTNATLTGITLRGASFGHAAGNDGRLGLVDGIKAAAGATGALTNTLTAVSVKAFVTLALQPAVVAGAATLTPVTLKFSAPTVTPTPGQVTTSVTPVTLRFAAVPLTGAPGPGSLTITPAVLRLDPVAVTPTPGQVTTEITPAVVHLQPGRAIVPIIEGFGKADGPPLGPERTWTRRVYLSPTEWEIVGDQARYGMVTAPTDVTVDDLQVPSPNIEGINDQLGRLAIASRTVPAAGSDFAVSASILLRFALYASDTNFRGYVIGFGFNDIVFVEGAPPSIVGMLYLGRYDAHDQLTTLYVSAVIGALAPGTLTARAVGNQISGEYEHSGPGPTLSVAVTDTTYTDGGVALLGRVDVHAGFTAQIVVDDFYAAAAPVEAATATLEPSTVRLSAVSVLFLDAINAGDTATPPTDIVDGGTTSTPPTDLNDPEVGLVVLTPVTIRLSAEPLAPFGESPGATPITPAVLRIIPGNTFGPITEIPAPKRLQLEAIESAQQLVSVGSSALQLVSVGSSHSLTALED
jgi:hypothetical protein